MTGVFKPQPAHFPGAQDVERPTWLHGSESSVRRVFMPAGWVEPASAPTAAPTPAVAGPAAAPDTQAMLEQQIAEATRQAEAEARARGEAEGRAAFAEAVERVGRILGELGGAQRGIYTTMEAQMIDLALCVAGAVLEREVEADRDYVLRLVKQAVGMVADGSEVEVCVSPGDYELIASSVDSITADEPRSGALVVRADEAIEAGCVVETRIARVDATVATRLRNIAGALHQAGEG
jgi:flagellar biosynthesis/type III secretory pathway protein FliH